MSRAIPSRVGSWLSAVRPSSPHTHSAWPLRDAWCSNVKPWLLVAVTSIPGTSVRTSTMPLAPMPAEMAECRGVSAWASCQRGGQWSRSSYFPWGQAASLTPALVRVRAARGGHSWEG
jgi:hypothetical protein